MKKEKWFNVSKVFSVFGIVVFFSVMSSLWSELTGPLAPAILIATVASVTVIALFIPRHKPLAVWYSSEYREDLAIKFPPLFVQIVSYPKWKEKGYRTECSEGGIKLYHRGDCVAVISKNDKRRIIILDSYYNEDIHEMLESRVLKQEFIDDANAKLTIVVEYRAPSFIKEVIG